MKTAIIGSRTFSDYDLLIKTLENFKITEVISGGARGADTLAEQYATLHNLPKMVYKPDYEKYGRSAPFVRNQTIIDNAEQVIAFWDNQSRGTMHAVDYARRKGKQVYVFPFTPKEVVKTLNRPVRTKIG